MKILGIIPARGGSKGIPKKNIIDVNGHPLIAYTISQGLKSKLLNKLIISTDSNEIKNIGEQYGAEIPFLRPKELADNNSKSVDVVLHAISFFEKEGCFFDAICLLQPTSPYRNINSIDEAINCFIKNDCESLISVRKIPNHFNPCWSFQVKNNFLQPMVDGAFDIYTQRQKLPNTYHRDGSIYIVKTKFIKKEKSFFSKKTIPFEILSPELINIDGLDDLKIAKKYLKWV